MAKDYPTIRGPVAPGIKMDGNVYVTMRDGVKVAVDISRPEKEGRYPVLLAMSPYIKEIQNQPSWLSHSIEAGNTSFFVSRGYIHVIAQIRGTSFSQGQYNLYSKEEQQDGYDLIEWIAKQPWCDGNVGMIGDSYFGMIQYLVAEQQPPHLKCIVPFDGCTDIYRDFVYQGGIFFSYFVNLWIPDTLRQVAWPGPVEGKLPPGNFLYELAAQTVDGPWYRERSAQSRIEKINVPVLNIVARHGFLHSRGQLRSYAGIKSPKKLMVMPYAFFHAHVLFSESEPLQKVMLRWYDYWLKGIDNGVMDEPPVAIFDEALQKWRFEQEYPLARSQWTKFYLRANPAAKAEPPQGLLSLEAPGKEKADNFTVPDSFKLVAAAKPVLAYTTPPLEKDLKVWGPLSLTLYGSTTAMETDWFARVGDVAPDGKVALITLGHLKASLREVDQAKSKPGQPHYPFLKKVLPESGKIYEYQIEMMPLFHTFKAGHKIWVQVASADYWYQAHLRSVEISEQVPLPAKNMVYHDAEHPSCLLIPVIPDAPVIKTAEAPLSELTWKGE